VFTARFEQLTFTTTLHFYIIYSFPLLLSRSLLQLTINTSTTNPPSIPSYRSVSYYNDDVSAAAKPTSCCTHAKAWIRQLHHLTSHQSPRRTRKRPLRTLHPPKHDHVPIDLLRQCPQRPLGKLRDQDRQLVRLGPRAYGRRGHRIPGDGYTKEIASQEEENDVSYTCRIYVVAERMLDVQTRNLALQAVYERTHKPFK
jgi:hypothetical protein